MRLRAVLHDPNPPFAAQGQNLCEVRCPPEEVYRDHPAHAWMVGTLERPGRHQLSLRIHVGKPWAPSSEPYRLSRCHEGVGRYDYLVSRLYFQSPEGEDERFSSRGDPDSVRSLAVGRERQLEFLDECTTGECAGFGYPLNRLHELMHQLRIMVIHHRQGNSSLGFHHRRPTDRTASSCAVGATFRASPAAGFRTGEWSGVVLAVGSKSCSGRARLRHRERPRIAPRQLLAHLG